jgi:GT2 family glycosyltransferase
MEPKELRCEIVIVGIVKNSAKTLLTDVARLTEAFSDAITIKWVLVESNSTDKTIEKLEQLKNTQPYFKYISLGKIGSNSESRTIGMAKARNEYLDKITKNAEYKSAKYFVVADFNGTNNKLDVESVRSCFNRTDWDVCTANQNGPYYDVWALRHEFWQPGDCWRQLDFFKRFVKFPEKALYISVHSKMIKIPKDSDWIEVDSAFGGLAIYKSNLARESKYFGTDENKFAVCEHVPFHSELRKKGYRIFINPRLINSEKNDHTNRASTLSALWRMSLYPIRLIGKEIHLRRQEVK